MEVEKPAALPVRNAALRSRFMSSVMDGLKMISVNKCADNLDSTHYPSSVVVTIQRTLS